MFVYTKAFIAPTYVSSFAAYINARENPEDPLTPGYQSIQRNMVGTVIVIIENIEVLQPICNELNKTYSPEQLTEIVGTSKITPGRLRSCLSMKAADNTEILDISVISKSPKFSYDVCRYLYTIVPSIIRDISKTGLVEMFGLPETPSAGPAGPNLSQNVFLGGIFGILLGAAIAFVRYLGDNTVKGAEDIKKLYDGIVLGETLYVDDRRGFLPTKRFKQMREDVIISKDAPFFLTEAYKTIRTNLLFTSVANNKKIIIITSSTAEEGKSTTTANLSITLAQNGCKVLLIDADLRRPTQHKIFKISTNPGLTKVLINPEYLKTAIKQNVVENLDVLTCGPHPPNPSELLGSAAMQDLLKALKDRYDYIIIDTPPINLVTDALVFIEESTGIVMVCKQNITTHDELLATVEKVNIAGAKLLGTIVTNVSEREKSYHGYRSYHPYTKNYNYEYK